MLASKCNRCKKNKPCDCCSRCGYIINKNCHCNCLERCRYIGKCPCSYKYCIWNQFEKY